MTMQSGGYDYEFVHTPSDTLMCQICHCPSKEPHLSACCGHTFCRSCLEAAKRVKFVSNACPMCRSEDFTTIPNKQADRIIRSLHVYCPNKSKGCEWQGEVNAITGHLNDKNGCQFQEIDCPNHCGGAYQRRYLSIHIKISCPRRKVNCQYCHDTEEYQFIEGQHKEVCPKLPLPCPNNCEVGNIPRDGIRKHIDVCPLQFIQCKYHTIGCEAIMARKDQEQHNKDMMEKHLALSVAELTATKPSIEENLKKQLAANTLLLERGFKEQLTAIKVSMEKEFKEQLLASQHNAQKTIHDLTQKLTIAEKEITSLKNQLGPIWSIDLLNSQAAKLLSGKEVLPVVVKMSGFTEKKRQRIEWFSEPFFTQPNGYKMQLSVLPDGDVGGAEGSHMTVCLYVMKGPYDEQLKWPMRGEYEVKLLNQINTSMHHSVTCSTSVPNSYKPTGKRNPYTTWYSKLFISHDALIAAKYFLKGDNIYFQVCKP